MAEEDAAAPAVSAAAAGVSAEGAVVDVFIGVPADDVACAMCGGISLPLIDGLMRNSANNQNTTLRYVTKQCIHYN